MTAVWRLCVSPARPVRSECQSWSCLTARRISAVLNELARCVGHLVYPLGGSTLWAACSLGGYLTDCFGAASSGWWISLMGRRRVYVNSIALPQTCRSSWHAIQPTIKRVMAGHQLTVATGSFLASQLTMEAAFATREWRPAGGIRKMEATDCGHACRGNSFALPWSWPTLRLAARARTFLRVAVIAGAFLQPGWARKQFVCECGSWRGTRCRVLPEACNEPHQRTEAMASPMRTVRADTHSVRRRSVSFGNSMITVEPSRKRPISSP